MSWEHVRRKVNRAQLTAALLFIYSPLPLANKHDWYLRPCWASSKRQNNTGLSVNALRQTNTNSYVQPVSLSLLMALDRRRTQPRKPAPCFLWIFLWFHTLMVIESAFPMYLTREQRNRTGQKKERWRDDNVVFNKYTALNTWNHFFLIVREYCMLRL